ncbi:uncharacterized protein BJ171DRAFT_5930 [Polychytrium aggregatum]|uniref:uncharacterized protein n=1 Tax=Polychytrium aggregatum TaxID=110093 RepID=UPI0022FE8154|nr:uncharacterized protein BJ171DRAFT_5930 [Polychytrium aggregatum]KAI9209691.1 hypothetical protein BJ171DRAFT_5930 [Polychytrium aggregatum]
MTAPATTILLQIQVRSYGYFWIDAINGIIQTTIAPLPVAWYYRDLASLGSLSSVLSPGGYWGGSLAIALAQMPAVSTLWFAGPSASTSPSTTVLVSFDGFQTFKALVIQPPNAVPVSNLCGGPNTMNIRQIVALTNSFVAVTDSGVFQLTDSQGALTWNLVLQQCVTRMIYAAQEPAFNELEKWAPLLLIQSSSSRGPRAWLLANETSALSELLSSSGATYAEAMGVLPQRLTLLAGAASTATSDGAVLLVQSSGSGYIIVQYQIYMQSWSNLYTFPSTVPVATSTNGVYAASNLIQTATGLWTGTTYTLVLSDMAMHRDISRTLFVWGNALFVSLDGGASFVLLLSFSSASTTITSFASDVGGLFVVETSDNQLWMGRVSYASMIQLYGSRSTPSTSYTPFFDINGYLNELQLSATGVAVQEIPLQAIGVVAYMRSLTCPYSGMEFILPPNSEYYIRSNAPTSISNLRLPQSIFLDKGGIFSFQIVVSPAPSLADIEQLSLEFILSDPYHIQAQWAKTIDWINRVVVYQVTITEFGTQMGYLGVGEQFGKTLFTVLVSNECLACGYQGAHSMIVYTGCPPFQGLVLPSSIGTCPGDPETPCFSFSNDFYIDFLLSDWITGNITPYNSPQMMLIVGGGPSLSSIQMYSSDQIARFNPGISGSARYLIYTLYDSTISFVNASLPVSWVCQPRSPCYGVLPMVNGWESPNYYFMLNISFDQTFTQTSYCSSQLQMAIRVYSLPIAFETSSIFLSVTILLAVGGSSLFIVGYSKIMVKRMRTELAKVAPESFSISKPTSFMLVPSPKHSEARLRALQIDRSARASRTHSDQLLPEGGIAEDHLSMEQPASVPTNYRSSTVLPQPITATIIEEDSQDLMDSRESTGSAKDSDLAEGSQASSMDEDAESMEGEIGSVYDDQELVTAPLALPMMNRRIPFTQPE